MRGLTDPNRLVGVEALHGEPTGCAVAIKDEAQALSDEVVVTMHAGIEALRVQRLSFLDVDAKGRKHSTPWRARLQLLPVHHLTILFRGHKDQTFNTCSWA